jgi:hypothetical protein
MRSGPRQAGWRGLRRMGNWKRGTGGGAGPAAGRPGLPAAPAPISARAERRMGPPPAWRHAQAGAARRGAPTPRRSARAPRAPATVMAREQLPAHPTLHSPCPMRRGRGPTGRQTTHSHTTHITPSTSPPRPAPARPPPPGAAPIHSGARVHSDWPRGRASAGRGAPRSARAARAAPRCARAQQWAPPRRRRRRSRRPQWRTGRSATRSSSCAPCPAATASRTSCCAPRCAGGRGAGGGGGAARHHVARAPCSRQRRRRCPGCHRPCSRGTARGRECAGRRRAFQPPMPGPLHAHARAACADPACMRPQVDATPDEVYAVLTHPGEPRPGGRGGATRRRYAAGATRGARVWGPSARARALPPGRRRGRSAHAPPPRPPDSHAIFRGIKATLERRLLEDNGRGRRRLLVCHQAATRFLWLQVTFSTQLEVVEDDRAVRGGGLAGAAPHGCSRQPQQPGPGAAPAGTTQPRGWKGAAPTPPPPPPRCPPCSAPSSSKTRATGVS